jgi:hypothetical protein
MAGSLFVLTAATACPVTGLPGYAAVMIQVRTQPLGEGSGRSR